TIRYMDQKAADLVEGDRLDRLVALPNIGQGIAAVIGEYVSTGQSDLLRELEAQAGPEAVLIQVPGIGKELARRITEKINIETLADLEAAAHDGRLDEVEGFGRRRVEGIRAALAGMLSRSSRAR